MKNSMIALAILVFATVAQAHQTVEYGDIGGREASLVLITDSTGGSAEYIGVDPNHCDENNVCTIVGRPQIEIGIKKIGTQDGYIVYRSVNFSDSNPFYESVLIFASPDEAFIAWIDETGSVDRTVTLPRSDMD